MCEWGGMVAWLGRRQALTFIECTKSLSECGSLVMVSTMRLHRCTFAQLTTTSSRRPNLSLATVSACFTSASEQMSAGTKSAWSPCAAAACAPFDVGRSQTITLAPFFTSMSAVLRPRLLAPPVTSAIMFCWKRAQSSKRERIGDYGME